MAYREVGVLELKEVLRRWLRGESKKELVRQSGLARNTVRRYLAAAEGIGLSPKDGGEASLSEERLAEIVLRLKDRPERDRSESWGHCEAERAFIAGHVENRVRLSKVRKLLQRRGVQVPYSTLYRFAVEELGFGKKRTTVPVTDGEAGHELQVDTGWMGYLEADERGKRRRYRAWIFTACYSRHRFVYPCFRETTETAIEACEAAWTFFGGVFRVLIPDNTKTIVQKPDALEARINTTFLEYAQARGFVVDATRVRQPRDKARVERAVQSTREGCFGGEGVRTIVQARELAVLWCREEHGRTRNTRTQRLPLEQFETEERSALLPAPSEPYDVPLWCDPKVHRDQHAQVDRALYSLPLEWRGMRLVGKTLRARADRSTVRFYFGPVFIKAHPRQAPGKRVTDPADFPPEKMAYATRDVAYLTAQAMKHGEAVGRYAGALLDCPLPWTRMRRVFALLGLCRRYGAERVEACCQKALACELLSVRRLERMIVLEHTLDSVRTRPKTPPPSRHLRPSSQYALVPNASKPEDNGHAH